MQKKNLDNLIIVRGGGDLATGVAIRLYHSGFDVLILESETPSAIRRTVALGQAVYHGRVTVEGITSELVTDYTQTDGIPVMIDPEMSILNDIRPLAVVDAIIAKKNLGMTKDLCDITVALGPGFIAGVDCHAVVETMRGHNLGRVLYSGEAAPNTGTPGDIKGESAKRVIHAPYAGTLKVISDITSVVKKGEAIAEIDGKPVPATLDGLVRGMLPDGYTVHLGMKMADIDPRANELKNCYTVSDKARALGGSVLEAVLHLRGKNARS